MAQAGRGQFQSRFGFVMAATGSAVGLGNIWGFPTQTAENGGAAFVLVYLLLAFCLAYPVLLAEFSIGRHAHANPIDALLRLSQGRTSRILAWITGCWTLLLVSSILAFYAIVGGWIVGFALELPVRQLGLTHSAQWLVEFGQLRNLTLTAAFLGLTAWIVTSGVRDGIERWCSRLMPALIIMLVLLIGYVITLDGAGDGLRAYLVPESALLLSPSLILSALGQAFFSLSLGAGTMMIYASYLPDDSHLPKLAALVTLSDVAVAVLAGLLIIPAMYVALHNGIEIYNAEGHLTGGDTLVFTVLPSLFDSIGTAGIWVGGVFFLLLLFAALTSSVSMLEPSVAMLVERAGLQRRQSSLLVTAFVLIYSAIIVFNFDWLFGAVISASTEYSQPLIGLLFCVFAGWIWHRDSLLRELQRGDPNIQQTMLWKIWPTYVKVVCPLVILLIVWQSL